ncbi:MAG: hypothetical protein L3J81_06145 [Thermoplasmata archaeon]|nr:hypothetical protein [Thermoplasmata archaeon]
MTQLAGIGGSGPDDVYAVGGVGYQPVVLHSADRSATWQKTALPFTGTLSGVWASGPGDTYVVGNSTEGAVIARSSDEAATWSTQIFGAAGGFVGVWGSGPNDVYVVGSQAATPPTDDGGAGGADADASAGDEDADLGGEGGGADGRVAIEGVVFHSTDGGHTWNVATTTPGALLAVAGTPDGSRIDAVGVGFTRVESTDHGATWTLLANSGDSVPASYLTAIWLSAAGGDPYIASMQGILRGVEGIAPASSIVAESESIPTSSQIVIGVWGITGGTSDEVYAVGPGGVIARRR